MKVVNIKEDFFIEQDVNMLDKIPIGVYLLHFNQATNQYYLRKTSNFSIPNKIYGNENIFVERVLKTFQTSEKNIGVLLAGIKGSGKSLTAKLICQQSNLPIILITECYKGSKFKQFLQDIKQEVIIFIDEFEKVYLDEEVNNQEEFLPILDGIFENRKLFIFTSNTIKINKFLRNRPNRIRYLRKYDGLENNVIEEIINDLLIDKSKKQELIEVLELLSTVSTDVLLHIISEMNMYNETAREVVRILNIQLEHTDFNVRLFINGTLHHSKVDYNPLTAKTIYVPYKYKDERFPNYERYGTYEMDISEMKVSCYEGKFEFVDKNNNTIIFEPTKKFDFNL